MLPIQKCLCRGPKKTVVFVNIVVINFSAPTLPRYEQRGVMVQYAHMGSTSRKARY